MAKGGLREPKGGRTRLEEDKKLQVPLYVETHKINKLGRGKIRAICASAIDEELLLMDIEINGE